jgi:hypothetical protein
MLFLASSLQPQIKMSEKSETESERDFDQPGKFNPMIFEEIQVILIFYFDNMLKCFFGARERNFGRSITTQ